ncbi:hypothetical protein MM300_17910 [Evansella sp. LMS18]|jgi:hypothetical protein|uniref:hypothetical protein n=1 Tax=Evansella sp. LMS18 TaxID=2924033 RepID=UPI0020D1E693|nr:hypothetical protein [Evansella sp. LMS18]UTR09744.1 hypothetical protein MM300_17910 [Evansella sp. LMS18]
MLTVSSAFVKKEEKSKEELIEEIENLEYQVFRMQENMKEISKRGKVLGIEMTKEEKWVIVYAVEDKHVCKINIHDCETPYQGHWDFSIQASYTGDSEIHIDDIRGEENKGLGSVGMKFLQEHAREHNIQFITGVIAERDWGHLNRLVHFYNKHDFYVEVDETQKKGKIYWERN